jgi:hypothetical protein
MAAPRWQDNKTLLHAWLLMVFPVGLYALWVGSVYEKPTKWGITAAVVLVFLALNTGFDALLALILAPLAVFLLWKDKNIARATVYKFAAGAAVILVLFLAAPPAPQSDGGCTYYRDSNYNVFARSCD